jgi:hypothetical protein
MAIGPLGANDAGGRIRPHRPHQILVGAPAGNPDVVGHGRRMSLNDQVAR